jgi:site-specific recombinase
MLGFNTIARFLSRWKDSKDPSQALDRLLIVPEVNADLADRNRWLIEVAYWLRRQEVVKKGELVDPGVHPEHIRLKALLKLLGQRTDVKLKVAQVLRSILRDNDSLSLFCDTGVATKLNFWGELFDRIRNRLIAPPPNKPELSVLFALGFIGPSDAAWVFDLDDESVNGIYELIHYQEMASEKNTLYQDLAEAIHILISYIGSAGLSYSVRSRLRNVSGQHSPFYRLAKIAEELLKDEPRLNEHLYQVYLKDFKDVVDSCYIACDDVYSHLDENGVSVDTVFQVETMRLRLARVELLLQAWLDRDNKKTYAQLVADLILTVQSHRSVGRLVEQSFALLSRKVVERSAETGEHYIVNTRTEYFGMLRKSLGGGAVIAGTTYLKFLILNLGLARFFENIFLTANYAGSFLLIQFAGFTLATKQPAMTAPALAQLLDGVDTKEGLEAFVRRSIALIRSQVAAVLGNLAMVIPLAVLIQVAIIFMMGSPMMSAVKAQAIIQSVSPFSGAFIFAAFTGVLLWLSSLSAGLVDNWFVLHNIQDVIRYNRRLNIVFGELRATKWSIWWRDHISVVAANVSLALLLVYGPAFMAFLGFGFDIRHVTLSAGSFASAATVLGWKVFLMSGFWLGILGILIIGLVNILVSFSLAFHMALRSRDLPLFDRKRLYAALKLEIKTNIKEVFVFTK